jgi:hypothetical protein
MAMDRKSSGVAIPSLAVIALVAATLISTFRGDDAVTGPEQMSKDRANPAPIILAQGRCFNGACY